MIAITLIKYIVIQKSLIMLFVYFTSVLFKKKINKPKPWCLVLTEPI